VKGIGTRSAVTRVRCLVPTRRCDGANAREAEVGIPSLRKSGVLDSQFRDTNPRRGMEGEDSGMERRALGRIVRPARERNASNAGAPLAS